MAGALLPASGAARLGVGPVGEWERGRTTAAIRGLGFDSTTASRCRRALRESGAGPEDPRRADLGLGRIRWRRIRSASGAARPRSNPLRVRGGDLRFARLRREPTTASSVSASSGVPVTLRRVSASALDGPMGA
jgi:hypothetical protein